MTAFPGVEKHPVGVQKTRKDRKGTDYQNDDFVVSFDEKHPNELALTGRRLWAVPLKGGINRLYAFE
jgi:hypothetical protein